MYYENMILINLKEYDEYKVLKNHFNMIDNQCFWLPKDSKMNFKSFELDILIGIFLCAPLHNSMEHLLGHKNFRKFKVDF